MRFFKFAVAAALCGLAFSATAADRYKVVKFPRGAHFDTEQGSITGYDSYRYSLGANAGQVMSVLMNANINACYFNVIPPVGDAIHVGQVSGNEYAGRLPQTGNYIVEVYMMRSVARRGTRCDFDLTFEIR